MLTISAENIESISCRPDVTEVIHLNASGDGKDDEPEPKEDVNLLVDDVQRENTEPVELLHRARGTELVEGALRHLHNHRNVAVDRVNYSLNRSLCLLDS